MITANVHIHILSVCKNVCEYIQSYFVCVPICTMPMCRFVRLCVLVMHVLATSVCYVCVRLSVNGCCACVCLCVLCMCLFFTCVSIYVLCACVLCVYVCVVCVCVCVCVCVMCVCVSCMCVLFKQERKCRSPQEGFNLFP